MTVSLDGGACATVRSAVTVVLVCVLEALTAITHAWDPIAIADGVTDTVTVEGVDGAEPATENPTQSLPSDVPKGTDTPAVELVTENVLDAGAGLPG